MTATAGTLPQVSLNDDRWFELAAAIVSGLGHDGAIWFSFRLGSLDWLVFDPARIWRTSLPYAVIGLDSISTGVL